MADERKARPVSGEIMAGAATGAEHRHAAPGPAGEIVDADYEVLPRFRGRTEPVLPAVRPPGAMPAPSLEGMDMLRKPETGPAVLPPSRGGPLFWIAGLCAALAAFWISGGHALVRQAPFFAVAQETGAALTISGVTSRVDASGPKPVLFVDGEAANDGASPALLPTLEIHVTGNDGRSTRYRLGTSSRSLAPGERFAFSSRLDVPRNGVKTVSVTFAG